jgi:hypothetical protein
MAPLPATNDGAIASVRQPVDGARRSVSVPLGGGLGPAEGSVLFVTIRSVALVILAVLLVFVLLPAVLAASVPGALAAF